MNLPLPVLTRNLGCAQRARMSAQRSGYKRIYILTNTDHLFIHLIISINHEESLAITPQRYPQQKTTTAEALMIIARTFIKLSNVYHTIKEYPPSGNTCRLIPLTTPPKPLPENPHILPNSLKASSAIHTSKRPSGESTLYCAGLSSPPW